MAVHREENGVRRIREKKQIEEQKFVLSTHQMPIDMRHFFSTTLLLFLPLFVSAQSGADLHLEAATYTTASGQNIETETGHLVVLENRDDKSSTPIKIEFVRLKSKAASPIAPVVYLEGGPGSSASWMVESPQALERWVGLLSLGDVILLDQRGTGNARERMTWINVAPLPEDVFVTEKAALLHMTKMVPMAVEAWNKRNIDLDGYDTMESAKDIDALRQAFGLDKVSILGFSYGTHLGQTYMKYFGEHLDKAILVGVEGLGETLKFPLRMDAQFRKLAAMVAADGEVNQDIPNLEALYQRVAQKLADSPVVLSIRSPLSGEPMDLKVGKFGLDYVLARDLGDASDLPVIPRLLYDIDQGDYASLTWFVQKRIGGMYGLHAMALATDIASGASTERLQLIERQAKESLFEEVINQPYKDLLKALDIPELGDEFRSDFTSSTPTLLLSGTLDMNTPPYQAERLRWSLPNAHHIIVQNAGHEQILTHPAIGPAIGKFLMGGDVSEVTASYPPLKFVSISGKREGVWHPAVE